MNNEKIDVPSYKVPVDLENKITFNPASKMSNGEHPERTKEKSRREKRKKGGGTDETDIFTAGPEEIEIKAVIDEPEEEIVTLSETKIAHKEK